MNFYKIGLNQYLEVLLLLIQCSFMYQLFEGVFVLLCRT